MKIFLTVLGMLVGIGLFMNGMATRPENAMGQIYSAIYIVGGALVFGVACALMAVAEVEDEIAGLKKDLRGRSPTLSQAPVPYFTLPQKPSPPPPLPPPQEEILKCACSECNGHIAYAPSDSGKDIPCPHCGKQVALPT